jgi:hypothetical protein
VKFYFVAWYDPHDCQLHPIHGVAAMNIAITEGDGERVPLFDDIGQALDYLRLAQEVELGPEEQYVVGLFDGETGEWEEVVGT